MKIQLNRIELLTRPVPIQAYGQQAATSSAEVTKAELLDTVTNTDGEEKTVAAQSMWSKKSTTYVYTMTFAYGNQKTDWNYASTNHNLKWKTVISIIFYSMSMCD